MIHNPTSSSFSHRSKCSAKLFSTAVTWHSYQSYLSLFNHQYFQLFQLLLLILFTLFQFTHCCTVIETYITGTSNPYFECPLHYSMLLLHVDGWPLEESWILVSIPKLSYHPIHRKRAIQLLFGSSQPSTQDSLPYPIIHSRFAHSLWSKWLDC